MINLKLLGLVSVALVCALPAAAQDAVVPGGTAFLPDDAAQALLFPAAPAGGMAPEPTAMSAPAMPAPTPDPAPSAWRFGMHEEASWQLSLSYAYVRFRSSIYDVNMNGTNTTLVKYVNEWLGVEGTVTTSFGPNVNVNQLTKYLFYGGGARIGWRNEKRLEPWLHGVLGGVHVLPQAAGNGVSSFAYEAGGGVDWRWRPQVALRVQGDWVRSRLYHTNQNNFQIASGIMFNF